MSENDKTTPQPLADYQRNGELDRRKNMRRVGHDRREMFRFDLTKEDRRHDKDRRDTSKNSWGSDDPI